MSIRKEFHSLLNSYTKHMKAPISTITAQIMANFANLHKLMVHYLMEQMIIQRYNSVDAEQLVSQGISHLQHLDDPELEAKFYGTAGAVMAHSNPMQGFQFLKKALALSKSTGDTTIQCNIILSMAIFMHRRGNSRAALALCREVEQIAYQATDLVQVTVALETLAGTLIILGDYKGALIELNRAKELIDMCGLTGGFHYCHVLHDQTEIHIKKSEYAEAQSIHTALLQDTSMNKNPETYAYIRLNIALVDVTIGTTMELIQQNLDAARKVFIRVKSPLSIINCDMVLADLNLREGNWVLARAQFQEGLKSRNGQVVVYCVERLADSTRWPAHFQSHAKWPMICLCESHRLQEKLMLYKALLFIGDWFISEDEVTAHNLFTVALEGFTLLDVHRSRAQCFMRFGEMAEKKGDSLKAAKMWREARPLFERSLQTKDVEQIDRRLAALEKENQSSIANFMTLYPLTEDPDKEVIASTEVTQSSNTDQHTCDQWVTFHKHKQYYVGYFQWSRRDAGTPVRTPI
ncbi:hypothetical protein B0H16DRAFT_1484120 [Mycena metata]|uniref:Uncharacterized protein n=1 Tax=Mycena metata TaxID=1033252 RepID=A0AAD7GNT6_9AGAR|nr:hypothetical protein B0H16DRAFT_1484120 [Mycena metata]